MIRSMTGFGAASAELEGAQYAVEVRSLNNKYFKAVVRLPDELQGLEAEIETALSRKLTRGSVVATARFTDTSADAAARININAARRYLEQLLEIPLTSRNGAAATAQVDLTALLALPGVMMSDTAAEILDRSRPILLRLVSEASDKVLAMRTREGQALHGELHRHCDTIARRLKEIAERAPMVVDEYQRRLRDRINVLLTETGMAIRNEELIKEVAVYAERSDIAEEVQRLQGHLRQFAEIIDAGDEEPAGRTLDFLSQEMLREANTIASKSADVEISRRIVEIKGGIDRLKEQAQNVE
jgi:uncharacterized protein (TIGR00255 family)